MQKTAGGRQELILGLEDLFAAYRRVPGTDGRFSVVAVYDFIRKELRYYDVFGLNFGLSSAPLQFNRVAEFLVTSCKCIFGACVQHYYDDFMIVDVAGQPIHDFDELTENGEPRVWASSAQWALNKLCTEVGFGLEPNKHKNANTTNELLGVTCDLSAFKLKGAISFSPTEKRVKDILLQMRELQDRKSMTPREAQARVFLDASFGLQARWPSGDSTSD